MRKRNGMKVAMISSGLIRAPPTRGGAVEEYVFQLTKNLRELGVDAVTVDRSFPGDKPSLVKPLIRVKTPNMSNHVPKRDILQELSFGLASTPELKKYDLVHANTAMVGFAVAKTIRNSQRFVYTCHNPKWPLDRIHWGEKVIRKIESYAMRKSDAVIALNNTMKRALMEKANVPLEKLFLIPNGVDTDFFRPDLKSDLIDSKCGLEGKRIIVFVGKVAYVKRVGVLLEAYKTLLEHHKYKDLKLLIVGPLTNQFTKQSIGRYAQQVMQWAYNELPSDSYAFTGAVNREELRRIYSRAYVFVLPSFTEAFPLVLLEAMSSGCPVIGSASGGTIDVISNGFNGFLFRTGSSPDLAAKMNMLLSDETLRKSLGQNSRRIAEKAYDWHAIAKKLMEIYKRLLDYD